MTKSCASGRACVHVQEELHLQRIKYRTPSDQTEGWQALKEHLHASKLLRCMAHVPPSAC